MKSNIIPAKLKKFLADKNIKITKDNLLLILLVGVLLLVISFPVKNNNSASSIISNGVNTSTTMNINTDSVNNIESGLYNDKNQSVSSDIERSALEKQMETILSLAEGVGKVKVMITFKDNGETVLKSDSKVNTTTVNEEDAEGGKRTTMEEENEETVIYTKDSNVSVPYVIKELSPCVQGVLVVAEGGGSPTVAKNITAALEALFGIEANKIKVMKMEG